MKKASQYAYIGKKSSEEMNSLPAAHLYGGMTRPKVEADLNVVVLSFDGMKEAEKNLSGGDPYPCKKCGAILNKFSIVTPGSMVVDKKYELKPNQSLWIC